MKPLVYTFIALLLLAFGVSAQQSAAPRISLLTAEPGPEVFELYGHQAVRVQTPEGEDITYNFGLFNFDEPNFIYRFVKGETDYMGGKMPTAEFLQSYRSRGSKVEELVLNLKPSEANRMFELLEEYVKPENATYRYKYCTNNCATRVLDIMEASLESQPKYADISPQLSTYRKEMRRYDAHYPWYVLGIDIALGNGIDKPIGPRERMYVPIELKKTVESSYLADGRPLVKDSRVLVDGEGDVTLPPTPFLLAPLFWSWIILLASLLIVYRCLRHGWAGWRWWPSIWFGLNGLLGCLSMFLIFVSVHEATSPNILGWWLNPLWFVPCVTIFLPSLRQFTRVFLTFLTVLTGAMFIAWGFGAQSSTVPLMLLCINTLVLSVSYIYTGASTHRFHGPRRGNKNTRV